MAATALDLVRSRYSWEQVVRSFEQHLTRAPEPAAR